MRLYERSTKHGNKVISMFHCWRITLLTYSKPN
jgi:hypothetical protein